MGRVRGGFEKEPGPELDLWREPGVTEGAGRPEAGNSTGQARGRAGQGRRMERKGAWHC